MKIRDVFPDNMMAPFGDDYTYDFKSEQSPSGFVLTCVNVPKDADEGFITLQDGVIVDFQVDKNASETKIIDQLVRKLCKIADEDGLVMVIAQESLPKASIRRHFERCGFTPTSDGFMSRNVGANLGLVY